MTLEELTKAIRDGEIDPRALIAFVDGNELHVMRKGGPELFSDDVGPREVAMLLGIEDVADV